ASRPASTTSCAPSSTTRPWPSATRWRPSTPPTSSAADGGPPMRVTLERELKLAVGPRFRLPALPGGPLPTRVFTSTSADTADPRLARAGVTLRRRVERRAAAWQLKLPRGAARLELELAGGPGEPPEEMRDLITAYARGHALGPVATLRTRRGGVQVRGLAGPIAEGVGDAAAVLGHGKVLRRAPGLAGALT